MCSDGLVIAASKVLAARDPGRGGRGAVVQIRRGEASQAQDCLSGRREVLTAWIGVGSGGLWRRLRKGSWQGQAWGCLQQQGQTLPPTGFGSEVHKPASVGLDWGLWDSQLVLDGDMHRAAAFLDKILILIFVSLHPGAHLLTAQSSC